MIEQIEHSIEKIVYFKLLILIILMSLASQLYAQSFQLTGLIYDSQSEKRISSANIRIKGTTRGAVSTNDGKFSLDIDKLPATLVVSHIGYENRYIKIDAEKTSVSIPMSPRSYVLDPIDVESERIINILKDKPLYVWDYEIFEDNLLLLAYEEKSMFRPRLVLLSFNGDTLNTLHVKGARELYKDCLDNVHLISRTQTQQIYFDGTRLHLLYPNPIYKIAEVLDPCYEFFDGKYFVYNYYHKKQIIQYYTLDADNPWPKEFATYYDSLGLVLLMDTARFRQMSPFNNGMKHFEDLIVFAPVFAPLAIIRNKIYVFDYTEGYLEHLDIEGNLLDRKKISYHKTANWKEELLVDDALGKAYTVFLKNGIFTLYEINLKTGKLGQPIKIPDYPFIQKIKVYEGMLFFIYKEQNFDEYKKLFKMKL